MKRRLFSLAFLLWILGFLWFAGALPQPATDARTDAIVVLTGGVGRIERGLAVQKQGWASRMLVSGVGHAVKPHEFAAEYHIAPATLQCCITLGYRSTDTISNAQESADWIVQNHYTSVRLITTDWHMRRAADELRMVAPANLLIIEDAVHSRPSLRILLVEYHKLLLRRARRILTL